MSLDSSSPVGAVSLSDGRRGYNDKPFNVYSTYNSGAGIFGGLKLETIKPGSEGEIPTSDVGSYLESSLSGTATERINGLQFDVINIGTEDVLINKLSILMADAGDHPIEIWSKDGTHVGTDESGCDNWNNLCGKWAKLADSTVTSLGSGTFTETPEVSVHSKPGTTTSFVIVSSTSRLLTKTVASGAVENGETGLTKGCWC